MNTATCPSCNQRVPSWAITCPYCGAIQPVRSSESPATSQAGPERDDPTRDLERATAQADESTRRLEDQVDTLADLATNRESDARPGSETMSTEATPPEILPASQLLDTSEFSSSGGARVFPEPLVEPAPPADILPSLPGPTASASSPGWPTPLTSAGPQPGAGSAAGWPTSTRPVSADLPRDPWPEPVTTRSAAGAIPMAAPGQPPGQRLASISFYTGIITAILSLASCIPALGLCVACVLFFSGVFAAVLGFVAQGDMNRHGGGLEQDRSHARWGIVTGLLGVVIAGVGAILSLVLVAAISSSGPR